MEFKEEHLMFQNMSLILKAAAELQIRRNSSQVKLKLNLEVFCFDKMQTCWQRWPWWSDRPPGYDEQWN